MDRFSYGNSDYLVHGNFAFIKFELLQNERRLQICFKAEILKKFPRIHIITWLLIWVWFSSYLSVSMPLTSSKTVLLGAKLTKSIDQKIDLFNQYQVSMVSKTGPDQPVGPVQQ